MSTDQLACPGCGRGISQGHRRGCRRGPQPSHNYFAAVYLDRHDEAAEAAEQVARATVVVLEGVGRVQPVYVTEVDTGSDSPGVVVSSAELSDEDATALWHAYPYDETALDGWMAKGWQPAESGE